MDAKNNTLPKVCDHTSVGMLVWRNGKLLLIQKMRFPFAFAAPAGHCDGMDFEIAAKTELEEEVGLISKEVKLVIEGRRENPCRREDGSWHYWKIYNIKADGEVNRSESETQQYIWADEGILKSLAQKTENYRAGKISEESWLQNPGLEIVWYDWMKELKII